MTTDAAEPAPSAAPLPPVGLVWAEAHGGVIGRDGRLPWHVPEDLAHFKAVTLGTPVIMGRRTWESLPEQFRPLPGRDNIVVTRDPAWAADGAVRAGSIDEALAAAAASGPDRVSVIGGGELFAALIDDADVVELTEIDLTVDGDTFAPRLDPAAWREAAADPPSGWHTSTTGVRYRFRRLERA
ncbi:dihydrofolate reductase [Agromyces sp. Marseille-P2726]|uniref:dihydrofolate reductase n=1 Tax=Agromyces sp. Marseille-P2726 TaxID=2709132 RepID=UPI00156EEBDC|nr:dihydrofolate reductase [Agromyces sp. Marseille-P2726]